jgi:hypothetical protein
MKNKLPVPITSLAANKREEKDKKKPFIGMAWILFFSL